MGRLKSGSLLWVSVPGLKLEADDRRFLEAIDPAGVVIFRENVHSPDQVRELNRTIRESCPSGQVLIAVDQEGGRVARLREGVPALPPMRTLGETGDPVRIREAGRELGRALRELGFDVDFAPVLDVDSNPSNPIIGDRAFSSDPLAAGRLALAFAEGLEDEGITPCGKHFPGHGDTDLDSHLALPTVRASEEVLENRELVPFRAAIAAGIPMMMTAHVVYPAWDEIHPATLSEAIISGLLRDRLGYRGLVLSDDLLMEAVAREGVGNAALSALEAGCDGLLVLRNREAALKVFDTVDRKVREGWAPAIRAIERREEWMGMNARRWRGR